MREIADSLTATLEQALPVLEAVREEDASKPALGGGWSRKQVVGHLIDSASNNHQRFVRAGLAGGLEWPGYDQNGCVNIQAYDQAPWAMLLEIWSAMNRLLGHVLRYLPAEAAGAVCRIGNYQPMPLRELAQDYVSHLRHHLSQIGVEIEIDGHGRN
ncbi:MAG TPA: DinB family protein [Bryobacteraceae bacterium]|nr:DinB family protein [Bryobacteraceae bacterium]